MRNTIEVPVSMRPGFSAELAHVRTHTIASLAFPAVDTRTDHVGAQFRRCNLPGCDWFRWDAA